MLFYSRKNHSILHRLVNLMFRPIPSSLLCHGKFYNYMLRDVYAAHLGKEYVVNALVKLGPDKFGLNLSVG